MGVWLCDWTWRQGPLPALQVADEGHDGVWLKAGGAKSDPMFRDPWFERNAGGLLQVDAIRGAYWYLMPGNVDHPVWQQIAAFYAQMVRVGGPTGWLCEIDIEEPGITQAMVVEAHATWRDLSGGHPLWIYTRKSYWQQAGLTDQPGAILHEARWVSQEIRNDPTKTRMYEQYHAGVDPAWWGTSYAGWSAPLMLQFTDLALVAGKRTTASRTLMEKRELARYTA